MKTNPTKDEQPHDCDQNIESSMTSKLNPDLVSIEEQKDTNVTPDKVEEILAEFTEEMELCDEKVCLQSCEAKRNWYRTTLTQRDQDMMSEVVEKIEKAKYPKDSTQGCNCNGYNNALTEAQTIIKSLSK